jgi:hypothetical protein
MVKKGDDIPVVIGQGGLLNGQRWQISRNLVIGRDSSCDISIPDRQISRFHAKISPSHQGPLVSDLGSKNGTFVNGLKVENPHLLQDGDILQIALFQHFVYLSSEATIPLDSANLPAVERPRGQGVNFDARARRVWIGQVEVQPSLSAAQFRLLQLLFEREGEVIAREELIAAVWGQADLAGVSDQAFDALVRRLRKRLADLDPGHVYITTVRGFGVKFENHG